MDATTLEQPSLPEIDSDQMAEMSKIARQASEFLKALSHESRLMILCLLMQKERSVNELTELLGLRQASVSQQLQRLRGERLVATRRVGKQIYYTLQSNEARAVIGVLYDLFCGELAEASKSATPH